MRYKLGLRKRVFPLKLDLGRYINLSVLPTPPPSLDWSSALISGFSMLGNDQYGDCFFAAAVELLRCASANAQKAEDVITDDDCLAAYGLCTGFSQYDSSTDNGTEPGQGFSFLQKVGIAKHVFGVPVNVDWTNEDLVRASMFIFPGLMMGVNFPQGWENEPVWDVTNSPIVGGHEIYAFAYDDSAPETMCRIATWGQKRSITWAAAPQFINQLTANIPPEWVNDLNKAPNGFDLEQLLADEQAIGAI